MLPDDLKNYSAADEGDDSFRLLDDGACFAILCILCLIAGLIA